MPLYEDPLFAAAKKEIAASKALRHDQLRLSLPIDNRYRLPKFVEDLLSSTSVSRHDSLTEESPSQSLHRATDCWSNDQLVSAALEAPEQHFRQKAQLLEAALAEERRQREALVKQLEWEGRQLQQSHSRVEELSGHAQRFQALLQERDQDVGALRLQLRETVAELSSSAQDVKTLQEENAALRAELQASGELHGAELLDLKRLVLAVSQERAELARELVAAKSALDISPLSSSLPSIASLEDAGASAASTLNAGLAGDSSPESGVQAAAGSALKTKRRDSPRVMKKMLVRVIDGLLRSLNEAPPQSSSSGHSHEKLHRMLDKVTLTPPSTLAAASVKPPDTAGTSLLESAGEKAVVA